MALHHALLALLEGGESYGYELKAAFDRSVAPAGGALNIGHVYQLLERLQRDGLVRQERAEPGAGRTERVVYAITDAGREELEAWFGAAVPPPAGYRDDLQLKLLAAARRGAAVLREVVSRERAALFAELHALRDAEAGALGALVAEGAALRVQAQLELLEHAEARAADLARAAAEPLRAAPRARRAAS